MPLPLLPGAGALTGALVVAEGASGELVPGPRGAPAVTGPIRPAPVPAPLEVNGPWLPTVAPTGPNTIMVDGVLVSRRLIVVGQPRAMAPRCQPKVNDVGQGGLTLVNDDADVLDASGADVVYELAGRRQWFGIVSDRTRHDVSPTGAAGQVTEYTLTGALAEWSDVLVLPDFGATSPARLGQPLQDQRVFDWTTNGAAPRSAYGDSHSLHPLYAPPFGFQLPHTWPTPQPWWMWDRDPTQYVPVGDVYFRHDFGPTSSQTVQVWMSAYDYAEAWLDGVQVLVCDQPGVPKSVQLDVGGHYHLVTIKATNQGGRAAVLFAVVQVAAGGYGPTLLASGPIADGSTYTWSTMGYRGGLQFTAGQVITRLALEAQQRGTMLKNWTLAFSSTHDSAGRPWPATDAIAIPVGTTMLDVLRQLSEALIDYACAPGSRTLYAWVKGSGTGRSRALPWSPGVSLRQRDEKVTR